MKNFYLIWEPQSGYTKYRHDNIWDAQKEAERLARIEPGKEFFVLMALGSVKKNDVLWDKSDKQKELENDILF